MARSYLDLLRVFETKRRRALERLLRSQGVKFMRDRRGRPITTDGELEKAMHRTERALQFIYTRPLSARRGKSKDHLKKPSI